MLALRPIVVFITILLVPITSAYLVLHSDGKPENIVLVGILVIVGLALMRQAVFEPLYALRSWKRLARDLGWKFFGDLSHEPLVTGEFEGVQVVAGISAHQRREGQTERYRTLVSAPVPVGIPAGLRVYGRDQDAWATELSQRRRVATGDADLEDRLRCEGVDAEQVRRFVSDDAHRDLLLGFLGRWPGMLVHGGESTEMPAETGGASGLVTVAIVGRSTDHELLRRCIADVSELSRQLTAHQSS